jgi:hypothetical protein
MKITIEIDCQEQWAAATAIAAASEVMRNAKPEQLESPFTYDLHAKRGVRRRDVGFLRFEPGVAVEPIRQKLLAMLGEPGGPERVKARFQELWRQAEKTEAETTEMHLAGDLWEANRRKLRR